MRKVTASAVILTALTGCSQSGGIPSTQWSFKAPAVDELSATQTGAGSASSLKSLSINSSKAKSDVAKSDKTKPGAISFDSTKSAGKSVETGADAGLVVNRSASARFMGPAFEQPGASFETNASAESEVGSAQAGSEQAISLSSETYGLSNGLGSTQASTRPDPVAQVRAYLRSGNPSALTNQSPYSSQVYLSSLPVPNQYYDPSQPAADFIGSDASFSNDFGPSTLDAVPAAASTDSGFANPLLETSDAESDVVPSYSSLGLVDETLSATRNENAPLSGSFVSSGILSSEAIYDSSLPSVSSEPSSASSRYSAASTEGSFNDNGLPQLTAFAPSSSAGSYAPDSYAPDSDALVSDALDSYVPVSDVQAAPPEAQVIEVVQPAEEVSIGTAILNDLRRSSELAAADQTLTQDAVLPAEPVNESVIESPAYSPEYDLDVYSPEAYSPAYDSEAALELPAAASSEEPAQVPTIASLTQTMPAREMSPLIASFRSGKGLADVTPDVLPAAYGSDSELPAIDVEPANDWAPNDSYSLLLDGLRDSTAAESVSQSTIYVPIAEAIPSDESNVLIEAGASVQDALSESDSQLSTEQLSTEDFIADLAQKSVFSAVLSSQSLLASGSDLLAVASPATVEFTNDDLAAEWLSQPSARPSIAQRIPFSSAPLSDRLSEEITLTDSAAGAAVQNQGMSAGILSFDIFEKDKSKATPTNQSWQRAKVRRAKLTPVSNGGASQRQRLTLL